MVAEPSNPKGQGPLVRAPGFQVMWTFMASLMLMAADGGGNGELGALGMAESFVNMPEEPKAEEHHRKSCRKFEAYDGHQGEGQQGVQQIESAQTGTSTTDLWMDVATWKSTTSPWTKPGSRIDMAWACTCRSLNERVKQTGTWDSLLDNGEAWNMVNEIEPNDKHGNLNHFLEMNEYDMMDYGKQHLVINEFKVFDGAWFLENIDYKLGFAHCLDFIDLKIFEHHYMNSFVDTVFNGWQCLVKYVLKVTIFILRFFLYMVDKVMVSWYSGLMQLAVVWLCSLS